MVARLNLQYDFRYTEKVIPISVIPKKRGRPATGRGRAISFRIKPGVLSGVETWAGERGLTRSAALLALINIGMTEKDTRERNLECIRLRKKIAALQEEIVAFKGSAYVEVANADHR